MKKINIIERAYMKSMTRSFAFSFLLMAVAAASASAQSLTASQVAKQLQKDFGLQSTYSVDMVIQTDKTNVNSRMICKDDKCRTEMDNFMFNKKLVTLQISEGNKILFYHVFPDQKKYTVEETSEALQVATMPQIEELGTETYEGVVCIKRRITDVRENYRNETTTLFSPEQKNMPVKSTTVVTHSSPPSSLAHEVQNVMVYQNYDFSTPDDSLFTIPANYVKASSMQECMPANFQKPAAPAP